ncbi:hypothetical protein [Flavobacterium tegetincola]|uniref:hypothetical protein n=1 Tax=Flavobacterium tegetincola TaxID=150172 RepID=UPI0003F8DCDA|nr:hypothetical protein [Flavobacterium tegetincola]
MNRFSYFKVTFLSLTAGLFVGIFLYGLFDVDFSDHQALINLLFKSFVTAIITGLLLGLLNMFFKIGNFKKKAN